MHDLATLAYIGFTTEFGKFSSKTMVKHEHLLAAGDALAKEAVNLVLTLILHRVSSMSWHSHGWPGQLVLFASDSLETRTMGLERLRKSWGAFCNAVEVSDASVSSKNVVRESPFNTTIMQEVAKFACESGSSDEHILEELYLLAKALFSGWGQTKVIEDVLQRLRVRASRDAPQQNLALF